MDNARSGAALTDDDEFFFKSYGRTLFSNAYAPAVKDFLRRHLGPATLIRDLRHTRSWFFAVQASEDSGLQEHARKLIENRILGRDAAFNKSHGSGLKTPAKRWRFYFDEILAAVDAADPMYRSEDMLALGVGLLARLDIPYELIKGELEPISKWNGQSIEKQAASALIVRIKGPAYAEELSRSPRPLKKNFNVYVNGGYSPSSNY